MDFRFLSKLLSPLTGDRDGATILGAMPLALPTIAALTPPDVEVVLTDENVEPIHYDEKIDIVGISFLTYSSHRAYEIAAEYKKRGVYVVLGGIHASIFPEEAQQYADTVFVGEAEDTWPQFIEDFRNGTPKSTYRALRKPDLQRLVLPRWDLVKNRYYYSFHVQTTRGCSFDCDFCCVSAYLGRPRHKPVENVLAEIERLRKYAKRSPIKTIFFADDNIFSNRVYSKELFKALIPLKIQWSAQCSINIAKDDEMLDLARESGCRSLLLGFESISQESLQSINKGTLNKVEDFKEIVAKIHSRKINIMFMIVLGLEGDDQAIFEKTSAFLKTSGVAYPIFNILTPVPGTRLYSRLKNEGRLLHERWEAYDGTTVCFQPRRMPVDVLQQGFYWITRDQYSMDTILERIEKLWDLGVIQLTGGRRLARLALSLLLGRLVLKEEGEMADFVKEVIRMLWKKKGISIDLLVTSLNYFDFARNMPEPSIDFSSGAIRKNVPILD